MDYTPAQLALIEEHRHWNVDHGTEWWDATYDDFVEVAAAFGITVPRDQISFSGFWSQGDGASFEPRTFSAYDVIMAAIVVEREKPHGDTPDGYAAAFAEMAQLLTTTFGPLALTSPEGREAAEYVEFVSQRVSRSYCHECTVRLDTEGETAAIEACPEFEGLLATLDTQMGDALECIAKALYKTLEQEYYYLTSDDAVWDSLVANDITVEDEEDEDVAA